MDERHGLIAEDILCEITSWIAGPQLVLRSPQLIEQKGASELADILILVDDTLIVIQSKSVVITTDDLDDITFGRIRKRRDKALMQINTTLNAESHNSVVEAKTLAGVVFRLDWSVIKKKIGIITLNIPDDKYDDPEFRFQYPQAFEVSRGIDVHTFILRDLHSMCKELSTVGDFLQYLDNRSRCFSTGRFRVGNELDFFVFTKMRHGEMERALSPDSKVMLSIFPGAWESFLKNLSGMRARRDQALSSAGLVDEIIQFLITSIDYSAKKHGYSVQDSVVNYLRIIGVLSKLTLLERSLFADKILEKRKNTLTKTRSYFAQYFDRQRAWILFMLSNETDRDYRRNLLSYMCEQLCFDKKCCSDTVLGICANGAKHKSDAFDCVLMNSEEIRSCYKPDVSAEFFRFVDLGNVDEWSK